MYTYQKTLLYACRNIKEAIREYEKLIECSAYSSKYCGESCIAITERILLLVHEKDCLVELKELLWKILKNFTHEEK